VVALAPSLALIVPHYPENRAEGRSPADAFERNATTGLLPSELGNAIESDPMAEEMLYDSEAMRQPLPDRGWAMTRIPDEGPPSSTSATCLEAARS